MLASLVFPHQLFDRHPALADGARVVMTEDPLFFRDPHVPARPHRQRLVLHRASMRRFAAGLRTEGRVVTYVEAAAGASLGDTLRSLAAEGVRALRVADPADYLLERRLHRHTRALGLALEVVPSPGFLNTPADNDAFFDGRTRLHMADFYRHQRTRLGLLLDADGAPLGGQWSFDADNRKRLTAQALAEVPPLPTVPQDDAVAEARAYVAAHFADHPGEDAPLPYPTDHGSAAAWLEAFADERLARFGPYEDAIEPGRSALYHSVLTPMLNIGLLTPQQVLDAVLARAADAPLASVEGFVRQVIGWREFMRAAYDRSGVALRTANVWGFERAMPEAFYTGETGLDPVDDVIRRVRRSGYANHIERLMVLGGAFFLTRVHPDAVYQWFMELFADAYDWVMVPNVYGMSQHAAGPLMTTKPYFSGSAYLLKMSHYRRGPWADTWDALFWTFVRDHAPRLRRYHRLSMLTKRVETLGTDGFATYDRLAADYFARLDG